MAGAGRRTFVPGEVLTASNVNSYLMDQAVMVFDDATERDVALGTAVVSEGMVSYLADADQIQVYDSADWKQVYPSVANAGEIVQVVQTVKSDTFSSSVGSGSFVQPTGFSATITPKSATNKVLVFVTMHGSTTAISGSGILFYRIKRDSTVVGVGDSSGSRPQVTGGNYGATSNNDSLAGATNTFLDNPATTSPVTYSGEMLNVSGVTQTLYLNRNGGNANAQNGPQLISTITLMEVVA
jgi:hypothetical protein